jgi:subtilase family serine protease
VDINLGGGPMPTGPDLVPENFRASHDNFNVTFDICNRGTTVSPNFQYKWISPRTTTEGSVTWASTEPLASLAAGACATFEVSTFRDDGGSSIPATTVTVIVDPNEYIAETNEANNNTTQTPPFMTVPPRNP